MTGSSDANLTPEQQKALLAQLLLLQAENEGLKAKLANISQAGEALRQGEARFRQLLENLPVAVFISRADQLLYTNSAATDLTGYTSVELAGLNLLNIIRFDYQAMVAKRASARLSNEVVPSGYSYPIITKDGQTRWIYTTATTFPYTDGEPASLTVSIDITEQKQAEQSAEANQERFAKIFRSAPLSIAITRLKDGVYLDVNEGFLHTTEFTRSEIIGRSSVEGIWVTPEDRNRFVQTLTKEGAVQAMEVSLGSKYGRVNEGLMSAEIIELDGELCVLSMFLVTTERNEAERALRASEEKLRQSQEQLRQAQKMEAIGRLAGGVAHDFNNLLTAISGYSDLIYDSLYKDDLLREDVHEIQKAASRASALTRQLLAFSRKQVLQPQIMSLNEVVTDVEKLLRRLIGEDIELVTELDPNLAIVRSDPDQLQQVLLNLAVNSRDAMPNGGRITIETANVQLDEEDLQYHPTLKTGAYVCLVFSDTGYGMNAETKSHIFEPFFTTKEMGKGTGLGLATVYGIITQSGGQIEVFSEVAIGTTFKIYLPMAVETEYDTRPVKVDLTDEPVPPRAAVNKAGRLILLVEDEEGVRTLARKVLRKQGYRVLEARSGGEALLLCEKLQEPLDLLITDMVLPQMNGRELAKRLMKLQPEMRVLYMSGYTDRAIFQQDVLGSDEIFLQKPFVANQLIQKVEQALKV